MRQLKHASNLRLLGYFNICEHNMVLSNMFGLFISAVQTGALTGAGSGKPSSKGVKGTNEAKGANGGKVAAVEVLEDGEGEEEGEVVTDPSFLPRSWMPSWMLTMPRFVLGLHIIMLLCDGDML